MSLFGVRVNGAPVLPRLLLQDGTAAAPALAFVSEPSNGMYRPGATRTGFANSGGLQAQVNGDFLDAAITGAGGIRMGSSQNTLAVMLNGDATLSFSAAASTFAATATMTNGPRAANPVHWVEVKYAGGASTGRIPIW